MVSVATPEQPVEDFFKAIPCHSYSGPCEKALAIAEHYGFSTINPRVQVPKEHQDETWKSAHKDADQHYVDMHDKMHCLAQYIENAREWPRPSLISYSVPRKNVQRVALAVFGCSKSIAEAVIIKTTLAILKDAGHDNMSVDINTLGERPDRKEFLKEFVNHVKTNLNRIDDPTTQTVFKNDPLNVMLCSHDSCVPVFQTAPQSLSFLSEEARAHFKEVVEYIESMGIEYRLNTSLLGSAHHHSGTIFQIKQRVADKKGELQETILARGERNSDLYKRFGLRKHIPFVCASIDITPVSRKKERYLAPREQQTPKIYFVHLGIPAKQRVLSILDLLREKNISVLQTITRDTLGEQMNTARSLGIPYTIIMGLKEVQENVVIVREMSTRSQETVPVTELPNYLKKLV